MIMIIGHAMFLQLLSQRNYLVCTLLFNLSIFQSVLKIAQSLQYLQNNLELDRKCRGIPGFREILPYTSPAFALSEQQQQLSTLGLSL